MFDRMLLYKGAVTHSYYVKLIETRMMQPCLRAKNSAEVLNSAGSNTG